MKNEIQIEGYTIFPTQRRAKVWAFNKPLINGYSGEIHQGCYNAIET